MNTIDSTLEFVADFTRENTGKHFLDSGDHYGRVYDQPLPINALSVSTFDEPATISLTHWLAKNFDEHELHDEFYEWDKTNEPWFELVPDFMNKKGFTQVARDNVYNGENDFDQVFIYEVYVRDDDNYNGEWYYHHGEVITVIYAHTGCDVRGGYSSPMFLECNHFDYKGMPLDFQCGYYSPELTDGENERLSVGYSSYPYGQLNELGLERVEDKTDLEANVMVFKRDNGEEIEVHPQHYDI